MKSASELLLFVMSATLLVSAALVPFTRILARRFGIIDHPGERKIHAEPMPRLGGFAVFLAFTLVVVAGYLAAPVLEKVPLVQASGNTVAMLHEAFRVKAKLFAVLGGAALVFVVGLTDDVLGSRFPVVVKALGQVLAALVLVAADVRTSVFPSSWLNVIVTLLWVVGITNAFNLLDNMDGLAAGVALVASGVFLINACLLGELFISLILVAFMGSLLGFLFYNFHPASVFLGDCGSLFIGYVMASLTILERYVSHASSSLFPVLMPVLVLAVPLLDTTTVVVTRLREGRPIYIGDRCHLSHRLLSMGFSKRGTVLFIYLATFCLGLGAASLVDATLVESVLILLQAGGFVLLIMLFFERRAAPVEVQAPR